ARNRRNRTRSGIRDAGCGRRDFQLMTLLWGRQMISDACSRLLALAAALAMLIVALDSGVAVHAEDAAGTWVHPKAERLSSDMMGPFVPTSDGGILAIDAQSSYVSNDGGATWSEPRPLTGAVE